MVPTPLILKVLRTDTRPISTSLKTGLNMPFMAASTSSMAL